MVMLADTGARKLLHGAGVRTVARGVAADAVGMSFGLDGLWVLIAGMLAGVAHLLVLPFELLWNAVAHGFEGMWHGIQGFFASIPTALASAAHLLVEPFELLWNAIASAAAGVAHGFEGMWHGIQGFFASIPAALASAAHFLVEPFEALGRWIQTAAAGIGHGFDELWHGISGFFATAAHDLVLPFESFWRWIQTAAADIGAGFQGLWPKIEASIASILAKIAGAGHELVEPLNEFWRWIRTAAADAAAGISFGLDGMWPLIQRIYASLLAALATAAHEIAPRVESFWQWVRDAPAVALPYVLVIVAVVCVVALLRFYPQIVCFPAQVVGNALACVVPCCGVVAMHAQGAAMATGQAVVRVVSYCGLRVVKVLACVVPCCGSVAMHAPGAAGMLISRAAFVADPRHYFAILRLAGPVVASAVYCMNGVASVVAAPVAALFRA